MDYIVELTPPVAVRLRRDSSTLWRLISAHALLHQASRKRNAAGWVIATLNDYEAVRELAHDIMAEGVDLKISDELRETVAAVEQLLGPRKGKKQLQSNTVNYSEIGKLLGSGVDAAKRRALEAVSKGYLQNLENKGNKPEKICLGKPVPEGNDWLLPLREEVERRQQEDRTAERFA